MQSSFMVATVTLESFQLSVMRDNKLNEIGAGTNEVMIMIIAKNLLSDALKN